MSAAPPDAAWVVIDTPLSPPRLAEFCRDLERLYRINPYLEFSDWRTLPNGRFAAVYRNLSNGREIDVRLSVTPGTADCFTVNYDRGIKRSTRFSIDPAPGGSRLRITDDYASTAADAPELAEVDRSLHAWGVALRDYLRREARWGGLPPWRWYMRRVWVPMKPTARRITFIIALVTLAELALFALMMALYWIEQR